jgi:hypothetical protein
MFVVFAFLRHCRRPSLGDRTFLLSCENVFWYGPGIGVPHKEVIHFLKKRTLYIYIIKTN